MDATIRLRAEFVYFITNQAEMGLPFEVCGLVGGRDGVASSVVPIPNAASDPRTRYLLEPKAFVQAYRQIERMGAELIGIYHSHPVGEPIPSATDLAEASWPDAVYLIVGFSTGQPEVAAWILRRGVAKQVELVID